MNILWIIVILLFFMIYTKKDHKECMTDTNNNFDKNIYLYSVNKEYTNDGLYKTIERVKKTNRKSYIGWIWNYDKFTNKDFLKRTDTYVKYYKIPYEKDDFDKPLLSNTLDTIKKYDNDIEYENIDDTCNKIIMQRLFNFDKKPIEFYHIIIKLDSKNINYKILDTVNNDILQQKLKKLSNLIISESSNEENMSNILLNSNITIFQVFKINISYSNNIPYIYSIDPFPTIHQYMKKNIKNFLIT